MFLVAGLDSTPGVRSVLGLHETVCTGAADAYGRMKGVPSATLLHLGPGLANGLANLHNARRARSSVLNIVGGMATWHDCDPPLAMDIESLARSVSGFVRTSAADPARVALDVAQAVAATQVPATALASRVGACAGCDL
jgi:acetolactate synthase-1/2/3 large subunit